MPNILARRGVLSFVFMPESSLCVEQSAARFLTAQKNIKFAQACIDKTQNQTRTDPAAAAPRSFTCRPSSS
jgi:hypothetical protein